MSLISNEVALKKLICECSFLSFLLVCLFGFYSSFSFFQLFRFPLIWLMLRFKLKMNFHRGIPQTVCDVEYVTEPIRSLKLRGFQPSTRPRSKWPKENGNYMKLHERYAGKGEGHVFRVPFSCLRVSFYIAICYVAICCYLFYLFLSLKELATMPKTPWKNSPLPSSLKYCGRRWRTHRSTRSIGLRFEQLGQNSASLSLVRIIFITMSWVA